LRYRILLVLPLALSALAAVGGEPASGPSADICLVLNNRIFAPRSADRPLPLLKQTAEHTFTPACSVTWAVLNPKGDALPVEGCFRGSLLQLPNDSACGKGTGKLWVGARWVVTSADMADDSKHAAICQRLETGSFAGTRALTTECQPRTRELTGFKVDLPPAKTPATKAPPADPHP